MFLQPGNEYPVANPTPMRIDEEGNDGWIIKKKGAGVGFLAEGAIAGVRAPLEGKRSCVEQLTGLRKIPFRTDI